MALYEGNFIKLTALAPALTKSPAGEADLSRSSRDLDLHLCVDTVTRYTVDLRLTYLFEEFAAERYVGLSADPDLHLRVYLDARMVEVVSWSISHRHEILRKLAASGARELDRRWSRNIMLGKWLDYLNDMGHSFST
jgi:uncharacterized protein YqiB (DUF1249 family)